MEKDSLQFIVFDTRIILLISCDAIKLLLFQVETMKAERDVIESELKSATIDMKSTFLSALAKDGAIMEPQMSVESLGREFGPLQKQVKESIERQEKLIADIQVSLRRTPKYIGLRYFDDFRIRTPNLLGTAEPVLGAET